MSDPETEIETWIDDGPVLLSYSDHIATMTLNRPESSNGMNLDMMKALHQAVLRVHVDPRVRVIHLRGTGRNFCAGGDVQEFASHGENLGYFLREVTAYLQSAVGALIRLNPIVIAEVQGFAAGGGGMGLVCASDLVVAGENANFLAGATRVGMVPDGGATVILPKIIGFRNAMDIFLSNDPINAETAKTIGLINRVVPDDELSTSAKALCEKIAAGAPLAQAATKRLLWSGIGRSAEDSLPEEARTQSVLSATADAREGLAAVIERRKPSFVGN